MLKIKVKSPKTLPKSIKLNFEHIRDIYYDMYIVWGDQKILHRIVKEEQIKDIKEKYENLFLFDDIENYVDIMLLDYVE